MDTPQNDPAAAVTPMSLPMRLMNIYVAPGEVFDAVRAGSTSVLNWLLPLLLSCCVSIAAFYAAFSQPAIQQQMDELQDQALQKVVAQHKITAAQAEQSKALIRRVSRIVAPISMTVTIFLWFFAQSLALWLIGAKILKAQFTFPQLLNVIGLTTMILVLGQLANSLVVIGKGNMFMNLGPGLLLPALDLENRWHQIMFVITLPKLWYFSVLALGWSKLCSCSWAKSLAIILGIWIALRLLALFIGWGTVSL